MGVSVGKKVGLSRAPVEVLVLVLVACSGGAKAGRPPDFTNVYPVIHPAMMINAPMIPPIR
jgi:hypothetical protein